MKFNYSNLFYIIFLTLISLNASQVSKPDPVKKGDSSRSEPLPLTYQILLKTLLEKKEPSEQFLETLSKNYDLNTAYEVLKNPNQLGLKEEEAKIFYETLYKLGFEKFNALIKLLAQINRLLKFENISYISKFLKLKDRDSEANLEKMRQDLVRIVINFALARKLKFPTKPDPIYADIYDIIDLAKGDRQFEILWQSFLNAFTQS